MNDFEIKNKKIIEKDGWKVFHRGAPDFLCIKYNKFGKIIKIKFVEIKDSTNLSVYQKVWRNAIVFSEIDYELIDRKSYNDIVNDDLIKHEFLCIQCGKNISYSGKGRKPKYCVDCKEFINREKTRKLIKRKRSLGTGNLSEKRDEDFYKEFFEVQEEKVRLGFGDRKCFFCGSDRIRVDKKTNELYCDNCMSVNGTIEFSNI